ncbi:MAG TPA: thiamine diphosphokinase [Candidatus Intestinimonas pullistercoris]|uniref:Thiamine diphosphokinase n=1 Tax=Candidatus Intestinimonas pullistercoris TaxID=2838623 RepID=A0A9D2SZK3_9FIRM|nr:thiamine diphosphokinase [uncultured Intestinimonas sp.]HJC40139.1 thiamine diphosphokinase [Candidatus Intestinimonas pullistercoris]
MELGICHVVGAGEFCPRGLTPGPGDLVIAADGGFAALEGLGLSPDLVVGDFDSLGHRPDHPHVVALPVEKDDTDMHSAIRLGWERGYRAFRLYGGTGGRIDHTLANIQSLAWLASQRGRGWLVGPDWTATVLSDGGALTLEAGRQGMVSVFCLGDRAEGVDIQGLKYGLSDGVLTADYPLGVSNSFLGGESRVSVRRGKLLVLWYES